MATAARQCATSGLTALSHRLAKQFAARAQGKAGNLVFSPLSIHSALSLVAAGAQGRTLSELLALLGAGSREALEADVRGMVARAFPEAPQQQEGGGGGGTRVSYACGMWHDATQAAKPAYRDVAAASFRSSVRAVDFVTKPEEAAREINSWVAKETNNLIESILDPKSVNASILRLVVANAIYFNGRWSNPFQKSATEEDKFHCLDGGVVDAQFMRNARKQFIAVHDGFKVLRMPYRMGSMAATTRYSMCVLLPDAHDGLWSLMDKVASSPGFLQEHLPEKQVRVGEFRVPKFKLSFTTSVKKALQDLGVQAAFSSCGAELPDMLENDGLQEPLFLGDVNEEGTEAAAVTACLGLASCARQLTPPVDFVADHPFAFYVVEEVSGAILFAGHVLDPTQH